MTRLHLRLLRIVQMSRRGVVTLFVEGLPPPRKKKKKERKWGQYLDVRRDRLFQIGGLVGLQQVVCEVVPRLVARGV